ncbi:MAG TPA: hypothetical protein VLA00_01935 [Xanthobacteraceae bacterium]|nr:hypothetical protein [Xanthobacteraceae bacterium]
MRRLFAALSLLIAVAGAAHWVVPAGRGALAMLLAQEDPARLADLQLDAALDATRVAAEIEAALAADDAELAASFVALADARGLGVVPAQRARVAVESQPAAQALRGAGHFGRGLVTGQADDAASLAGATLGDLTVWGDVRDAGRQAWRWAKGEEVDRLMLGLSAAGIAATGATYAAFGAPLTLRAGLSLAKGARRTGALGVRLADDLAALVARGGTRGALRFAGDLGTVQSKAGTRATLAGLRHIDTAADSARLRRLADVKGGQTLAILKTLGRGALFVTEVLAKLAFWVLAAAFNLIGLIASLNATVVALVRPLWRGGAGRLGSAFAAL